MTDDERDDAEPLALPSGSQVAPAGQRGSGGSARDTRHRASAIPMLAAGASARKVAKALGVSRARVARWLADPAFAAEVQDAAAVRSPVPSAAGGSIGSDVDPVAVVREIAGDPKAPPSVRLAAARELAAQRAERREREGIDWRGFDPRSDPGVATLDRDTLTGIALGFAEVALDDRTAAQRRVSELSAFGADLDAEMAEIVMGRLTRERLPAALVEKLLPMSIGDTLRRLQEYVDGIVAEYGGPQQEDDEPIALDA